MFDVELDEYRDNNLYKSSCKVNFYLQNFTQYIFIKQKLLYIEGKKSLNTTFFRSYVAKCNIYSDRTVINIIQNFLNLQWLLVP